MSGKPYRVMVGGRYMYVGPDLGDCARMFANITRGHVVTWLYDTNDDSEPIIHGVGADGKPVASMFNVPFGAWETGQEKAN